MTTMGEATRQIIEALEASANDVGWSVEATADEVTVRLRATVVAPSGPRVVSRDHKLSSAEVSALADDRKAGLVHRGIGRLLGQMDVAIELAMREGEAGGRLAMAEAPPHSRASVEATDVETLRQRIRVLEERLDAERSAIIRMSAPAAVFTEAERGALIDDAVSGAEEAVSARELAGALDALTRIEARLIGDERTPLGDADLNAIRERVGAIVGRVRGGPEIARMWARLEGE